MAILRVFSLFVSCVLVGAASVPVSVHAAEGVDCRIAASAIESASRLRSLDIKRSVPCKLQNKAEVEQYLRDTIKEKIPEERIKREGQLNRMLGLLPRDYDYLNGLISLYTEQLGGYYDPEKEYYAMAAWMPSVMQMPIAVHELTHALQDQHFQLETLIDHANLNSDALLARSALIEGDATAVMLDYSRALTRQPSIAAEPSVSMFMIQNITGAMLTASLHKAPPALQATLIFPYISGLNFAHALLRADGYNEIDRAFKRLPATTEEILHPEKYLNGKSDYREIDLPSLPSDVVLESETPIFTDRLGEFIISTLLSTWLPPRQASEAASGWGGDRIALYKISESSRSLLLWRLVWDTPEDAREFFDALTEAYVKRYEKAPIKTSQKASFLDADFGPLSIQLDSQEVVLRIGG